MTDFDFSATANCDECGAYLSSSDEDCDHDGYPVNTHVFRRLGEGRESMEGVESTVRYKWDALEQRVGDRWIAYEWLGTKESVTNAIGTHWESVEELPALSMSLNRRNKNE